MPIPWLAIAATGVAELALWEGAKLLPRLWGKRPDEEVELEAKKANKRAMREFRVALESENERSAAQSMRAQADTLAVQSASPLELLDAPTQPSAPVPMGEGFGDQSTTPTTSAGMSPVADQAAGPPALNSSPGGSKFAALQQFSGTKLMANKLVSAALARGDQPTEFDYAGVMI